MQTTARLINKSAVRDYALAVIANERPHLAEKLTRVSGEFFERMETELRGRVIQAVRGACTAGKTLR